MKHTAALQHVPCCSLCFGWQLWCITKPCFVLGTNLGPWDVEIWALLAMHLKRVGIWLFMLSRELFKEKGGQLVIDSQMLNLRLLSVIEGLAVIYPWLSAFAGVHITDVYARLW